MKRAFIIVLDSFGIGSTKDANASDQGANTLRSIAQVCAQNGADTQHRSGALHIPNLCKLGLNQALQMSCGEYGAKLPMNNTISGQYGYAVEQSAGKDTPSGHWEMAGLPVLEDWGYFTGDKCCFPPQLIEQFIKQTGIPGVLGLCHASGTDIIKQLGEQHLETGKPIVYTSADSVFQIAAHEKHFGLERLYEISYVARKLVDQYRIGRVIARPFVGETANDFVRTSNRKDIATPPFGPTLLNHVTDAGNKVISIGKVSDIFAASGISHSIKIKDNNDGVMQLIDQLQHAPDQSLVFTNLNDFDTLFGHRRDVAGYAHALETFDRQLPSIIAAMQPGDLAVITADHGCDPTWPGSDHTREHIPVLFFGPTIQSKNIGERESFADIGQTLANHLGIKKLNAGVSV